MMELETVHDRGFYEAVAEEHPLLETIIQGETTLKDGLDMLLTSLKKPEKETIETLQLIARLGEGEDNPIGKMPHYNRLKGALRYTAVYMGGIVTVGGIVGVLLAALVPVLSWGALAALGIGAAVGGSVGCGALADSDEKKCLGRIKKKREEFLKAIYDIAAVLDRDISLCFMLDHFRDNRERFAQTYISLPDDEQREAVDEQLFSYLAAGGMPGMDEIQLRRYLGGLLEREESA